MNCILCLEKRPKRHLIPLGDAKSNSLNIFGILQHHFRDVAETDGDAVCTACWGSVSAFHTFCLKVESARKSLVTVDKVEAVKANEVPRRSLRKKLEEQPTTEPTTQPKRGRPKKRRADSIEYLRVEEAAGQPEECEVIECLPAEVYISEDNPLEMVKPEFELEAEETEGFGEPACPGEEFATEEIKVEIIDELAAGLEGLESDIEIDGREVMEIEEPEQEVKAEEERVKEEEQEEFVALLEESEAPQSPEKVKRKRGRKPLNKPKPGLSEKTLISKQYDEYIAANYQLICCLCQQPLKDFAELKLHFQQEHNTRGYVLCCGKKLLRRGVLVDHLNLHKNPLIFQCPKCQSVMSDRRSLEIHLRVHEEKKTRSYQCEVCSKSYFRRVIYLRHMLLHVPEEEKVPCPQCNKKFGTNYLMNQHLNIVHLNKYCTICDICGKSLRGREAFKKHQDEHLGVARPPIQCEHCGITVTSKYGLSRHLKVRHSEENLQPQTCSICGRVSMTKTAHARHMKYMHEMQRKHQCTMCDKAFKSANGLREHITTHTGGILYTCPHCPKTFNSNANMHSHRKKKHRAEWEEKRRQRYIPTLPPAHEEPLKGEQISTTQ